MRKSILFILLTFCAVGFAKRVSLQQAQDIALSVFEKPIFISPTQTRSTFSEKEHYYYIFNNANNCGFVIIGADQRLPKIIGYSDKGSFNSNKIPPQLSAMLDSIDIAMEKTREVNEIHSSWKTENTTITVGKLLNTAPWGQGYPYNNNTPVINGTHTPAGCGAVALAIIMKYHNWPPKGRGNHSYYHDGKIISYDFENASFDYGNMPEYPSTQNEIDAISNLIYAAGIALGTTYTTDESYFSSGTEALTLSYFFNYDPECQFIWKNKHTDSEWIDMTTDQIDKGLPVIYSGSPIGISSGHAWIVDGYNGEKTLFHCNFGWNGEMNGYYALNELLGNYHCDGMTINAKPNLENKPNPGAQIVYSHDRGLGDIEGGIRLSSALIETGKPFDLMIKGYQFINTGDAIETKIALIDKENNIKETIFENRVNWGTNPAFASPVSNNDLNISNLIINSDICDSDSIKLYIRRGGQEEWLPIISTLDASASCPLTGHDWPTQKWNFTVSDGIKVSRVINSADTDSWQNITNLQSISVFENSEMRLWIQEEKHKPDYRISCNVNNIHRSYLNLMTSGYYVVSNYNDNDDDSYSISTTMHGSETQTFNVNIEYTKISDPIKLDLKDAGNLESLIPEEQAKNIVDLTITGKLNALDLWYIADKFPILESLDLSETEILNCEIEQFPWYVGIMNPGADKNQKSNSIPEFGLVDMWALKKLVLPQNIITLGKWALSNNYRIKRLELPGTLNRIEAEGTTALSGHDKLMKVVSNNPIPPSIDDGVNIFQGGTNKTLNYGTLYVPAGSEETYAKANGWRNFKNIRSIDERSLSFNINNIEITTNEPAIINASLVYSGEDDPIIKWESSNEDIVKISPMDNGECFIYGLSDGNAIVTATAIVDNDILKATCDVIVNKDGQSGLGSINLDNDTFIIEGRNIKLAKGASIFNINGQKQPESNLSPGVYIIKSGAKAYKILIK